MCSHVVAYTEQFQSDCAHIYMYAYDPICHVVHTPHVLCVQYIHGARRLCLICVASLCVQCIHAMRVQYIVVWYTRCASSGGRLSAKLQIRIRKTKQGFRCGFKSEAEILSCVGGRRPAKSESETLRFQIRNQICSGNQIWTPSGHDSGRARYRFRLGIDSEEESLPHIYVGCGQYGHV